MSKFFSAQPIAWILLCLLFASSGCSENLVYKKSVGELNQRAQTLLAQGDTHGAVSRLESAYELDPSEITTLHNLAIAYQADRQYDKALNAYQELLKHPEIPEGNVHRSMGIVYEEMADAALTEVDTDTMKPDEIEAITQKAVGLYQQAIVEYQTALPNLKATEDVDAQIKALQERLVELEKNPNLEQAG